MRVLPHGCSLALLLATAACSSRVTNGSDAAQDRGPSGDAVGDAALLGDSAPDSSVFDARDALALLDATPDVAPDVAAMDAATDALVGAETSDSSLLPPLDASNPFTDAGSLGAPAWVPLQILTSGMCTALAPCGGDVVGTWDVTGGCVSLPLGNALTLCPSATIATMGQARGRIVFDGTTVTRVAQYVVQADVTVPASCASFVGGCSGVQNALQMRVADSNCVALSNGDCQCAARQLTTINDSENYTLDTANNQIVGTMSGKRWSYCITGTNMDYQDQSTTGTREPGIIQLGRR